MRRYYGGYFREAGYAGPVLRGVFKIPEYGPLRRRHNAGGKGKPGRLYLRRPGGGRCHGGDGLLRGGAGGGHGEDPGKYKKERGRLRRGGKKAGPVQPVPAERGLGGGGTDPEAGGAGGGVSEPPGGPEAHRPVGHLDPYHRPAGPDERRQADHAGGPGHELSGRPALPGRLPGHGGHGGKAGHSGRGRLRLHGGGGGLRRADQQAVRPGRDQRPGRSGGHAPAHPGHELRRPAGGGAQLRPGAGPHHHAGYCQVYGRIYWRAAGAGQRGTGYGKCSKGGALLRRGGDQRSL